MMLVEQQYLLIGKEERRRRRKAGKRKIKRGEKEDKRSINTVPSNGGSRPITKQVSQANC
jgi:hypothetical protein